MQYNLQRDHAPPLVWVILPVPSQDWDYTQTCLLPKPNGGICLILDLKFLNKCLHIPKVLYRICKVCNCFSETRETRGIWTSKMLIYMLPFTHLTRFLFFAVADDHSNFVALPFGLFCYHGVHKDICLPFSELKTSRWQSSKTTSWSIHLLTILTNVQKSLSWILNL